MFVGQAASVRQPRKTVSGPGEPFALFFQDLFSGLGPLPSIYGQRTELIEAQETAVSSYRQNTNSLSHPATRGYWFTFTFWFSFGGRRGSAPAAET